MSDKRYYARAIGRVQGVGFRYFVKSSADVLGLTGWVKNMTDGSVTMEVQGDSELIASLWQNIQAGNGFIKVSELSIEEIAGLAEYSSFDIRH